MPSPSRTLRRTLIEQNLVTAICLLLLSATAVWGVRGLAQDSSLAVSGYEQLRDVYEVAAHVAMARTLLSLRQPETTRALIELESASTRLQADRDELTGRPLPALDSIRQRLADAQQAVSRSISLHQPVEPQPFLGVMGVTSSTASTIRLQIEQAQRRADARQRFTVIAIGAAGCALLIAEVIAGVRQYRSIMRPVTRLQQGVRTIAGGDFSQPLIPAGPRELRDLAQDFNAMSRQLNDVYRNLEQQVRDQSKELARSQHLASVGFLAAGVAHEINNPLGVITGFAELTLQQLRDGSRESARASVEPALQAICDEAFRCKRITEQLLSMSAKPERSRLPVNVSAAVTEATARLVALKTLPSRRVIFDPPAEPIIIDADSAEIGQLLLNLLANAAEALPATGGRIDIALGNAPGRVKVQIRDNGCGMDAATIARAFEPFFTLSHDGRRGTGLGLAISQSIAEAHGGTITAASDGPGTGSTFTWTIPTMLKPRDGSIATIAVR